MDPIHIHVCLAHSPSRAHALFTKLVNFKLKSINQHTLFSDKIADSPFNRAHRELFAVLLSSLCWIVCMLQWLVIVFNEKKILSRTRIASLCQHAHVIITCFLLLQVQCVFLCILIFFGERGNVFLFCVSSSSAKLTNIRPRRVQFYPNHFELIVCRKSKINQLLILFLCAAKWSPLSEFSLFRPFLNWFFAETPSFFAFVKKNFAITVFSCNVFSSEFRLRVREKIRKVETLFT